MYKKSILLWKLTFKSANCCANVRSQILSITSQKTQLRALLSPLQTDWTGFDPYLYSIGSSSAGPALVEIATARSFILNRSIVTDAMSATPLESGWSAFHSTKVLLSARSVPCGPACRPVGIDCLWSMLAHAWKFNLLHGEHHTGEPEERGWGCKCIRQCHVLVQLQNL